MVGSANCSDRCVQEHAQCEVVSLRAWTRSVLFRAAVPVVFGANISRHTDINTLANIFSIYDRDFEYGL